MAEPRVVIVTGATGGIGSKTAEQFAKSGEILALLDHPSREKCLGEFVRKLNSQNYFTAASCWTNDITDANDVERCVVEIIQRFGKIDVLVNIAGAVFGLAPLVKTKPEDIKRSLEVNLLGMTFWCRAVLPHMRKQAYGRIVNVASVMGVKGDPGNLAYAAAKAGVISVTKTLAGEAPFNKDGRPFAITVNAVAPGIIDTDMTKNLPEKSLQESLKRVPFGRKGRPEEVADLIYFLSGDTPAMNFITGTVIPIDGGYLSI